MPTEEKVAAVAELTELFERSEAAVLTEYRGLTVSDLKGLRTALGHNATYAVAKNTLARIAARNVGIEGLDDHLKGPTAIAFVTGDVAEAAKSLRAYAKDTPTLVIKGGVISKQPIDAEQVSKLADLEPREVLLAKLAGALKAPLAAAAGMLNAPLTNTAGLLNALPSKTARTIAALQEKKTAA